MKAKEVDRIWKYVFWAYLTFWVMILGIGGIATMVFNAPASVMKWVTVLCSWSPTFVLWAMLKQLMPGMTIKAFYKKVFKEQLQLKVFLAAMLMIAGIFLVSAGSIAYLEGTPLSSQITFVPALLGINILFTALQGPSGEESGWRGYLLGEMTNKYGFVKGNIILGLVWSFWHMPLWFISTGYSGLELLIYILSVVICLTSLATIMGIFMKKCNNLLLAFWMHFCFNLSLTFFIGDVYFFGVLALLYAVVAIVLMYAYVKRNRV